MFTNENRSVAMVVIFKKCVGNFPIYEIREKFIFMEEFIFDFHMCVVTKIHFETFYEMRESLVSVITKMKLPEPL